MKHFMMCIEFGSQQKRRLRGDLLRVAFSIPRGAAKSKGQSLQIGHKEEVCYNKCGTGTGTLRDPGAPWSPEHWASGPGDGGHGGHHPPTPLQGDHCHPHTFPRALRGCAEEEGLELSYGWPRVTVEMGQGLWLLSPGDPHPALGC